MATNPFNPLSGSSNPTGGIVTTTPTQGSSALSNSPQFNFAIIVQVPLPILEVDVKALIGALVGPVLSQLKIPQALQYLITHAEALIQTVVDDLDTLIQTIPQATASLIFKVGDVTILNIFLVAQQTPVIVQNPTFQLALPNFAVDLNIPLKFPFPIPPPIVIRIPIPVPQVAFAPIANISGGGFAVGASVEGQPVQSPIVLPNIGP